MIGVDTIYEAFSDHELGRELQTMSEWLDVHRNVLSAPIPQ